MARCKGITRAGSRCKRPAGADAAFCSLHLDQAVETGGGDPPREAGETEGSGQRRAKRADRPSEATTARGIRSSGRGRFGGSLPRLALIGGLTLLLLAVRRLLRR